LQLINNYTPLLAHTAPNEENEFSARDVFNFAAYIKLFPKDDQRFVSEFARSTTMFGKFAFDSFECLSQGVPHKEI
jgi:hypothetical protein